MSRMRWDHRLATLALAALFGSLEFQIYTLQQAVGTTREKVADTRVRLADEADRTGAQLSAVARKVAHTEEELHTVAERHRAELTGVEQEVSSGLGRIEDGMRREVTRLESAVGSSVHMSVSVAQKLGTIQETLRRDPAALREDLLAPTVQVRGAGGIGAGTIVHSAAAGANGAWRTYALTAFHVVEKAVAHEGRDEVREAVKVRIFAAAAAEPEELDADLAAYDEPRDLAVLRLRTDRPFPHVARLASRDTLRALTIFTPIYAVGCPLGHNPMPSPGEITSLVKELNGQRFWMMSAPTIYGNSGGGVFLARSHELIGLASMICVYDNFISLPVPHLGIFIPIDAVYDWLDAQGLAFLYRPGPVAEAGAPGGDGLRATPSPAVQVTWDY